MVLCPKCGNPYEASAKYCPCCGSDTGYISVPNPEDTTFLNCTPAASAAQNTPCTPAASAAPAVSAASATWAAPVPVSGGADIPAMQIPASGSPDTSGAREQHSAARGLDPEPVTPPDNTITSPIWVTRSMNQPITDPLDESFLDDPSLNTPADEDTYSKKSGQSYASRVSSSSSVGVDVDIFDEVFETTSLIYSNMPSKIKKFIIISIVTTLLSIIPVIYVACSQQKDPGVSKDVQTSLTDDWVSSWNAAAGT